MNSDKSEDDKVPDGWEVCRSKSNPSRVYYFNRKTGESSWSKPQANEKSPEKKASKKGACQETNKKEEAKKSVKRKSSGNEDAVPSNKRQKHGVNYNASMPCIDQTDSVKIKSPVKASNESPASRKNTPTQKSSPSKPQTLTKNLANTRLSQLRMRLSAEAAKSVEDESPSKKKSSPKQKMTEQTNSKQNKSSNSNESKSSTTPSPNSDGYPIASPSQFFTATKIISAIKVQLSEQLDINMKPKDSFADIEERISKQTPEHPHTKHPATPPQFSEASKIVSAIHSKISHKVCSKDMPLPKYSSAKERMDSLRASLSNEVKEEPVPFLTEGQENTKTEAMDVDFKETTLNIPIPPSKCSYTRNLDIRGNLVLVVDTNVFIHELGFIRNVVNSHIKGYTEQPTLLIPWRVISELDRLKDNNNGTGAICKRARAAMDYLYKSLPENERIRGQSLRDANSHIYPCESPDDEILNCCLQQAERGKSVILLSNDKNLCTKAVTNDVKSISLEDLKILMEHKPQPTADPDLYANLLHYKEALHELLGNILESEMRAKYNKLWQHVVFKPPPWILSDVLLCLLKHWVAVFSEVFPRIEHLIQDLRNTLASIERKDPNTLSKSEVENFRELSLEVAIKCQIIPEYMEIAKATVERLTRTNSGEQTRVTLVPKSEDSTRSKPEIPVIAAFEELWTIFSGYCAKLATALGVPHSIEDKVPTGETLHTLNDKWPIYSRQINTLTMAMKGALGLDNTDPNCEEQILRLVTVFKESLRVVSVDSDAVNVTNMSVFCSNCRNMLQEACSKFSELSELLRACENNVINKVN